MGDALPPVLVVGCGSDLRRDDAAGRRVAERIAERLAVRADAEVEVRSVTQLVPELAAEMAGRELVVFVDAQPDASEVTVRRVSTAAAAGPTTHHMTPEGLLALAGVLEVEVGEVVVVGLPVADLGLGVGLSAVAEASVAEGESLVRRLCDARGLQNRDGGSGGGMAGRLVRFDAAAHTPHLEER